MTRPFLILLAAAGSAALLAGAFAFQYIGGMAPCHLCLLQRYPHGVAVGIGVLALLIPAGMAGRLLPWAGALAALTTAGYGAYHTGVERKWWQGPDTCTSSPADVALETKDLLAKLMATSPVQCDQVAWQMLGLSMASWNMVAALALVAIWVRAARTPA